MKLLAVLGIAVVSGLVFNSMVQAQDQQNIDVPVIIIYDQTPLEFNVMQVEIEIKTMKHSIFFLGLIAEGNTPKLFSLRRFCNDYTVQLAKGDRYLKRLQNAGTLEQSNQLKKNEYGAVVKRGRSYKVIKATNSQEQHLSDLFDVITKLYEIRNPKNWSQKKPLSITAKEGGLFLYQYTEEWKWKSRKQLREEWFQNSKNLAERIMNPPAFLFTFCNFYSII